MEFLVAFLLNIRRRVFLNPPFFSFFRVVGFETPSTVV